MNDELQRVLVQRVRPEDISFAKDKHRWIAEKLANTRSVAGTFLSGSYSRKTNVRPLNDVDIVVVLNNRAPRQTEAWRNHILNCFCNSVAHTDRWERRKEGGVTIWHLRQPTGHLYVRIQKTSVGISFDPEFEGISFDLVPAKIVQKADKLSQSRLNVYQQGNGIRPAAPGRQKQRVKRLTERFDVFLDLVRLAKYWNQSLPEKAFKSIHLEVLVCRFAEQRQRLDYADMVELFRFIAQQPLGQTPDEDGGVFQLPGHYDEQRCKALLRQAADQLQAGHYSLVFPARPN